MRKLMYIFAAHVLVLGGLWLWKNVYSQPREPVNIPFQVDLVQRPPNEEKIRLCLLRKDLQHIAAQLRQGGEGRGLNFIRAGHDLPLEPDSWSCFDLDLQAGVLPSPLMDLVHEEVNLNFDKHWINR